ncbi:MAG: hypothetical protein MPJ22_11610 [Pirellulales bacterium]|nr:hypothetical protein [Pirellulales bacterium]
MQAARRLNRRLDVINERLDPVLRRRPVVAGLVAGMIALSLPTLMAGAVISMSVGLAVGSGGYLSDSFGLLFPDIEAALLTAESRAQLFILHGIMWVMLAMALGIGGTGAYGLYNGTRAIAEWSSGPWSARQARSGPVS